MKIQPTTCLLILNFSIIFFVSIPSGKDRVVDILIQSGAHVNIKDIDGVSPILYATQQGNFFIF